MKARLGSVIALATALTGAVQLQANTIALEGSDATTFHGDAAYTNQLFTYLRNGNTAGPKVLVLGGSPLAAGVDVGSYVLAPSYSLLGFDLSSFAAVYIESPGGCCSQADGEFSAADQAAIGAAEAAGLNLAIQDYGGGPGWGAILPANVNALPASVFGGITNYGTAGGPGCTDEEVFNALGLSKGFTQPPVLGCYEHQAYQTSAFLALGTGWVSLVDADPAYFGADGSAFLALGGALGAPTSAVPEPAETVALCVVGAGLLTAAYRRKVAAARPASM